MNTFMKIFLTGAIILSGYVGYELSNNNSDLIDKKPEAKAPKGSWQETNQSNCQFWNNFQTKNRSVTWTGGCLDGYASGKGELTWYQNSSLLGIDYTGFLRKGKRHGQGTLAIKYVWTYNGEFFEDNLQGRGKITYANGNTYNGDWVVGEYHGQGVYTWAENNHRFVGEFANGLPNGYGILYRDDVEIEGDWKDGCNSSLFQKAWVIVSKEDCGY